MAKRKKTPPELDKAVDTILAYRPKRLNERKTKVNETYKLKKGGK